MDALKILVVEDDFLLGYRIQSDLVGMGYNVVGPATNSEEALDLYHKEEPSLVLMDIDLEGSDLDGIQIAEEINDHRPVPIIFLSGLGGQETVNRAKKVNPAYYLIKPCNARQLQIAIDFAIQNFVEEEAPEVDHSLKHHEPLSGILYGSKEMFFIKRESKYVRVDIADIVYVKAESPGNNIRIVTEYAEQVVPTGMKYFMEQIRHPRLMRINRSYVINTDKIAAFDGGSVTLVRQQDKVDVSIGNTYKEAFLSSFLRLKTE